MGMDFMAMFADMPLIGILGFLQEAFPQPANEIVAELLAQVHGKKN